MPIPHGDCEPSRDYVQTKCLADCKANYVITNCSCKTVSMRGEWRDAVVDIEALNYVIVLNVYMYNIEWFYTAKIGLTIYTAIYTYYIITNDLLR